MGFRERHLVEENNELALSRILKGAGIGAGAGGLLAGAGAAGFGAGLAGSGLAVPLALTAMGSGAMSGVVPGAVGGLIYHTVKGEQPKQKPVK